MSLSIIILAAGQGKRMHSSHAKVLHLLAGKPLLQHVYDTAVKLEPRSIYVVHGYGSKQLMQQCSHFDVVWVEQEEQLGTGHAVKQALIKIPDDDLILVLYGDVPLITSYTLIDLIKATVATNCALLVSTLDDPKQYGRIVRDKNGQILRIVEAKDASDQEKQIREINTGIMATQAVLLKRWLGQLDNNNAQGEFYLTDVVAIAVKEKINISTINPRAEIEIQGINDRIQLSELERYYQLIQAHQLMRKGVSLMDPGRFDLRGHLEIGIDCTIDVNVILQGQLKISNNVSIAANCQIKDSVIHEGAEICANSVIENAVIGRFCRVGPFARIRPDTVLDEHVHIGNFVEVKKSNIGKATKINHLSYIGDSEIGMVTNIGAGTITCNYDGAKKHQTIIGDNVFIGSDVQLIAPVTVSAGATVAAGTTVTRNVAEDELAISRQPQKSLPDWKRPE